MTAHLTAEAHHAWRCPKCDARYVSPLPVIAMSHQCRMAPGRQTSYVPADGPATTPRREVTK